MIPPVEERQIRPCEDCVCFIPGSTSCKMVYLNRRWLSKDPCKYHLTRHEYQMIERLFGFGNVNELNKRLNKLEGKK